MQENASAVNRTQHSPVAHANKKANAWKVLLFLVVTSVLLIAVLLFYPVQHHPSSQAETFETPILHGTAPQLSHTPTSPSVSTGTQAPNNFDEERRGRLQAATEKAEEAAQLEKMRMVAPTTVYSAAAHPATTTNYPSQNGVLGGNGVGDTNTQFMAKVSEANTPVTHAHQLIHPDTMLVQGTLIWATEESRIVSDLPGMIRAVTSEDIYAEDGSQVLLPKGSRLIGQYTNAVMQGQERAFVIWQRVLRPDHLDIMLNSPGVDPLGTAGIAADQVDHHFFAQFGTSILLSIISAGTANIGVSSTDQFNSASAYREALANSFSQTSQGLLKEKGIMAPTLSIQQGTKISVFVARDLDFYDVLYRVGQSSGRNY